MEKVFVSLNLPLRLFWIINANKTKDLIEQQVKLPYTSGKAKEVVSQIFQINSDDKSSTETHARLSSNVPITQTNAAHDDDEPFENEKVDNNKSDLNDTQLNKKKGSARKKANQDVLDDSDDREVNPTEVKLELEGGEGEGPTEEMKFGENNKKKEEEEEDEDEEMVNKEVL
jgi:hypothetical protein